MTPTARPLVGLLSAALVLAGCSGGSSSAPTAAASPTATLDGSSSPSPAITRDPSPTDTGTSSDAVPAPIGAALDEVRRGDGPLTSVVVRTGGRVLAEAYAPGGDADTEHAVWSVTKSVVSALVGIAVDEGLLDVDTRLGDLVGTADGRGPHADVTVGHLLTMTSGIDLADSEAAFQTLYAADDWLAQVLNRPAASPPGEEFAYCSGCVHLLTAGLEQATGGLAAWAQERLFGPLGFGDVDWERAGDGSEIPIGGWGLRLTGRELARFGQLFLDEGTWQGQRLVSADWVRDSTATRVPLPEAVEGWLAGYGYLWWIPQDQGYAATGRGGQLIVVVPERGVVVAATADLSDARAHLAFAFVRDRILAELP